METLTQVVFPAMGNTVNLTVIGHDELVSYARQRLTELEQRWSRFISSSDVSRLNRAGGRATPVHADTLLLIRYLVDAQRVSNGVFDPTLAPALNDSGYSTSRVDSARHCELSADTHPRVDLSTTTIIERFGAVTLPFGATLDAGGLGKGLAADIVARELMDRGAAGVCLSIGGDIRCMGSGPIDGNWTIDVVHPSNTSTAIGSIRLHDGGIATSSVSAKRWHDGKVERHHVFDPATGTSLVVSSDSIVQSSVIAAEAVWAEVFATMSLVGQRSTFGQKLACLVVRGNGTVEMNDMWPEFTNE
jgi:thiamine biosynthesis lipoprotein